jgi:signal peptidase complex subunit 2
MAKPKQQKPPAIPAVPVVVEYEEAEMELLQVDVGDMVKLKQILDETVASTLLGELKEDYRWDNVKLGIMATACVFAMIAQFAPVPFPESRPLLGVCCCLYFLLSGILQFITTFIDKDCILMTKPLVMGQTKNTTLQKYGVRVRSNLPRFSEYYSVILEFQNLVKSPHVEQKWSVGQFFDVEGMFDEVGLMQAVEELYKRLEAGNYDTSSDQADKKKKE